jgi:hypothetical protein
VVPSSEAVSGVEPSTGEPSFEDESGTDASTPGLFESPSSLPHARKKKAVRRRADGP